MMTCELGGEWKLVRESDGSGRPCLLPGDIMSALLASGEISDPYLDRNELAVQWVGREDWRFVSQFVVSEEFAASARSFIDIPLIDTIAEVILNDVRIGENRSMFIRFRKETTGLLRTGVNRIEIRIRSPEREAERLAAALPYPIPYSIYPVQSPHRNLVRKEQCMGGWDWGPCLMTGGVYDGISLVAHSGPRIEYLNAEPKRHDGEWRLDIEVELNSVYELKVECLFILRDAGGGEIGRSEAEAVSPAGTSLLRSSMEKVRAETWWPAGHGGQPLYALECRISTGSGGSAAETTKGHSASIMIGFREIAVLAEEDAAGKSMTIVVNGKKIFAKGANWIPADALPSRRTPERLEDLLGQAAAAGMNCLRVWGGGRYESEAFYDLCDRFGILVWQDCMFSCALYPADRDFLGLVEEEIRHQARRLKSRACLALWCGNNEALGAITWYGESRGNPDRYLADYEKLTYGVLGGVLEELDPGRTFWPSSPSAGPGDYSDNWHADGRGDMHFWAVWHEGKPFSEYLKVRPRFCSEFGFQSFPSPETVESFVTDAASRRLDSAEMEHHQRHPRGNALIADTMARYFREPAGFRQALYLSQVQQAWAIRTAVEWWRSLHGECMGTLYWQLNDTWPVSSWSGIEYSGKPKLLQYEAARFYRPIHLAILRKDGEVRIVGINEQAVRRGSLTVRTLDFSGRTIDGKRIEAELAPDAATCIAAFPEASIAGDPGQRFLVADWRDPGLSLHADAFLAAPKECSFLPPGLSAVISPNAGGSLAIDVASRACAFFVQPYLEKDSEDERTHQLLSDWRFSDAGFTVLPDRPIRIEFAPANANARAAARRESPAALAAAVGSSIRFMDLYSASES